jgi:hypothetical protein
MRSNLKASVLAALCFSLCSSNAFAQTILNQSKDDLLKDFDVGKTLTAPAGPQFSGTGNPAPPASWAPQSSPQTTPQTGKPPGTIPQVGSAQPAGLIGNYGQGPYQSPPQKRILQRIIEGAMNAVNVSNTEGSGTHVKAPFVDVNVGGPEGVRVKAPFVKYNSNDGAAVKAPFVKYNSAGGTSVKAPLVNVNSPEANQGSSLK